MEMLDHRVVAALFRKDLRGYLANPTGYVFLTLFISATAAAAFVRDDFFARNLADLALLNELMPAILMVFIPALTMSSWADEHRFGTDELLLTLPVRDIEVVLGKYSGALGLFTVALAFSSAHLVVLAYLGDPDPGLMVSTYLGYWFMGALLVSIGLLGSMLSGTPTGGFVLGVLGCAGIVFAASEGGGLLGASLCALAAALVWLFVRGDARFCGAAAAVGGALALIVWLVPLWPGFEHLFEPLSLAAHFHSFGEGVIRLEDISYFVGGTCLVLYLCSVLLGRRHW